MRILSFPRLIIISLASLAFFSCDEKEDFNTETITDYLPQAAGKYITYRLDSMVFTNFGTVTEIHKYQVKHQVDALVTDNLGRPAYRVFRYLRDSAGTQAWQPNGSYLVTLLDDQAEVADDNLRVIKLHLPVKDGFSWKGNKYLPDDPYYPLFDFNNDDNMADWDFYYDGSSSPFSYKGINYSDVITVEQVDEEVNIPINPQFYAAKSRSVERYSKSIGLVYRQLEIWEFQPPRPGGGGNDKKGFGITMWMIDHN